MAEIITDMGFGDWTNIVLALTLLVFGLRDIFISNTKKDYSKHKNVFIRWFFSRKEHVIAKHFLRELGLSPKDFIDITKGKKQHDYKGAIKLISKCIVRAEEDAKYQFGRDTKHQSSYYVDSMGFAQKKENCEDLYNIMTHLIGKVNKDKDYQYVFSIKGGNIPLAVTFSKDHDVLSIMPKDKNERVNSGFPAADSLINYEGFRDLVTKAKDNEGKEMKGIAITCNLTTGSTFLNAIETYNKEIEKLKESKDISDNIKKIENVYILYKVTKGNDLDDKYEHANLKCYRYFDLNEELKLCLLSIQEEKKKIDDFPCYQCIKGKKPKCTAKYCYKKI